MTVHGRRLTFLNFKPYFLALAGITLNFPKRLALIEALCI
ncbi:MAG: hypothetical protein RLZ13_1936 [Bacteroidota bacterium]